ncbi:hypothetical protein DSLASN_06910 [Desulfoluna limicola]|uniref:Tetratricopeptide repeat protein n=1 Tax=Desulfoluna limicola TaxID=2810562 RepID=A0ABM7PBY6_9BACT|nr:hypothetical protein DSLASN_06910 [Desulfoluna limicola]
MVRHKQYVAVLSSLLMFGACQGVRLPSEPVPFPDALQTRALALEARGDTTAAIRYWEAASAVSAEKVTALHALRRERIETELLASEKALAEGDGGQAITHLLKVLRMEPSHAEAKERLRGTLSRSLVMPYTVYGGESADTIAGRAYKNVRLAPLIEVLYGRDAKKGQVYWLPSVEASLVAAQFSYTRAISRARKDYTAESWGDLLAASEEILSYAPGDKEALFLKNTAAHNLAEALFQEGDYREALGMYRRVDAYFRNEKPRIEEILSIQKSLRDEARARKNATLLEEAILLEKKGALVAARNVLNTVDKGVPGRIDLERRLTRRMNRLAEVHYRAGVQLFLEENLVGAIAEWERSLELNPGHIKAGDGVENAMRLLEKVKGIELKKREKQP